MRASTATHVVAALLERYPRSFAEDLRLRRLDSPAGLFQLLVAALLMSARIRARVAAHASAALFGSGWTTPARMARADWADRARVLNEAGYARYDERTSTMLGDTAALVLERYGGDLRRLRDAAGRDPSTERRLLKECKGIGDVGVDIFFREVQRTWTELYPFADQRILRTARRLGLPDDPRRLARLVPGDDFIRLVDAVVRVELDKTHDDIRDAASRPPDAAQRAETS